MRVPFRRLRPEGRMPARAYAGDAGYDLAAAEGAVLAPGERVVVGTGIALAIPEGYAGLVLPRSGLATRFGVSLVNAPGTIDAGYRGEIKVSVVNLDPDNPVTFAVGDRIGQLIVQEIPPVRMHEVDKLPGSDRAESGFGSTGA